MTWGASGAEPDTIRRHRSSPMRARIFEKTSLSHTEWLTCPPFFSQYFLDSSAVANRYALTPPASAAPEVTLSKMLRDSEVGGAGKIGGDGDGQARADHRTDT